MTNLFKAYLVALLVVFLHFAGQITNRTLLNNRYFFRWDHADALAIVLDLFVIALGLTLLSGTLGLLTRRFKLLRSKRVLDHLFLLALVSGLLAAFPRWFVHHPRLIPLIWAGAIFAIAFSLARGWSWPAQYGFNLCLAFSPLPLILSVQMLTWETWHEVARTEFAVRNSDDRKTPVFLFVFDEWSYPRSTTNGSFRPFFSNVRALAQQSVVFRDVRSPYQNTKISIPRLIYQSDYEFSWKQGRTFWHDGREEVPSTDVPSLLELARQHGYNAYVMGWLLPYGRMLGEQADYVVSYSIYPKGSNLLEEMALAALRNLEFWTDPLSNKVWQKVNPELMSRYTYNASLEFRAKMLDIIDTCPPNTFAVFHVLQPHGPHVFNRDGTYSGASSLVTATDYQRSLTYLDSCIGEVVGRLRRADKFDEALIVITSDHAFQSETEPLFMEAPEWDRWVPLFVKLPGQQGSEVVDDRFYTNRLQPLFESVFSGERQTETLLRLVRSLPFSPHSQGALSAAGAGSAGCSGGSWAVRDRVPPLSLGITGRTEAALPGLGDTPQSLSLSPLGRWGEAEDSETGRLSPAKYLSPAE